MRDNYINFIREYIKRKHGNRETIEKIKSNVLGAGATEGEFNEAIAQIAKQDKQQSGKTFTGYIKTLKFNLAKRKRLALNLSLTAICIITSFSIISNSPVHTPNRNVPLAKTITQVPAKKVKTPNQNPIPQVYANARPIDPQKVFSFPQSNVPLTIASKPKKEVLGFFPYWMLPESDKIPLDTFTSVALFGIEVDGKGDVITSHEDKPDGGWLMWRDPKLDSFIKKARDDGLKIFLTFKSFSNTNIESLVSSDSAQQTFISNALYLINSKSLDGINLDFEYAGIPEDNVREGFTRLVKNLNTELKRQIPTGILTIDTYIISGSVRDLFDIQLLSKDTDAFVIMGYDMHYSFGSPGPISPMGGAVNIIGLVQGYLEKVPAEKLILAVPYYGYDWPINTESSTATPSAAIISYAELAQSSKQHKLTWDDTSQTPSYKYSEDGIEREVHFENVRSLGIKYDFAIAKGLKGVGIWALGYDGLNSDLQRLIVDKFSN